jgi:hypothetical protein
MKNISIEIELALCKEITLDDLYEWFKFHKGREFRIKSIESNKETIKINFTNNK